MEYRALTLADIDDLIELGRKMHGESQFSGYRFADERVTLAGAIAIASPQGFCFGAWDGDKLIGFMLAEVVYHGVVDINVGREMYLYVDPEHRGSFVGKHLISMYEQWCKALDVKFVFLDVSSGIDQDNVVRLTEILGYENKGVLMGKEL